MTIVDDEDVGHKQFAICLHGNYTRLYAYELEPVIGGDDSHALRTCARVRTSKQQNADFLNLAIH
jgi:hypothetical protein